MRLKDEILKYKIEILVIGVVVILLLPFHIYESMTHFDDIELGWNQPFEQLDRVTFVSSRGSIVHASVSGTMSNRPSWFRLNTNFNLMPTHYVASIEGSYNFADSSLIYNSISIVKRSEDDFRFRLRLENRSADINIDTLRLSNIQINGVAIPDAFYINKSNSKNTYGKRYKKLYRLVDEILWSKPLGLVYFKTADSTEYYRSDVFYDIPIDKSSPR